MEHKAILTVETLRGVTVKLFTNGHRVWNDQTVLPIGLDDFLDAVSALPEWNADGYRAALENVTRTNHHDPSGY